MPVDIIVKGIVNVPAWAGTCPLCGSFTEKYTAGKLSEIYDPNTRLLNRCMDDTRVRPIITAAIFSCDRCGTRWQWYDKQER